MGISPSSASTISRQACWWEGLSQVGWSDSSSGSCAGGSSGGTVAAWARQLGDWRACWHRAHKMHTPARSGAHRRDEVQEAAPDHLGKVGVRGGACAGPGAGCGMGGPAKRCRRGVWQAGRQARTLLSFLACRRRRRIRLERRQEGAQHGAVGWLCQARPLQQLASAVQRQGAHPARQVEAVEGASWGGEEPCVTTSGAASLVSRVAAWPGSHAAGVPAQRRQRPRVPGGGGHGRQHVRRRPGGYAAFSGGGGAGAHHDPGDVHGDGALQQDAAPAPKLLRHQLAIGADVGGRGVPAGAGCWEVVRAMG